MPVLITPPISAAFSLFFRRRYFRCRYYTLSLELSMLPDIFRRYYYAFSLPPRFAQKAPRALCGKMQPGGIRGYEADIATIAIGMLRSAAAISDYDAAFADFARATLRTLF